MKITIKDIKTKLPGFGLTVASILVITLLHWMGVFDQFELKTYDYRFHTVRGPLSGWRASDSTYINKGLDIVLVEVDDEAWRLVPESWPYPRGTIWSQVIQNLYKAGAKVIAFDIQFDAPEAKSDYLHQFANSLQSEEFRHLIPKHGDVVLGEMIAEAKAHGTAVVINTKMVMEVNRVPPQYISYPTDAIMAGNPETGLINDLMDSDGFSRQYAVLNYLSHDREHGYLTLGLKCVKAFSDIPDSEVPDYDPTSRQWTYGAYNIQSYGESNAFLVNYYGPASGYKLVGGNLPAWGTYPRYSLAYVIDTKDVELAESSEDIDWMSQFIPGEIPDWILAIDDAEERNEMITIMGLGHEFDITKSPFYNKIVMIGTTVETHHDFKQTPFYNYMGISQITPGLETHANAIQTILHENYIQSFGGRITEVRSDIYSNRAVLYHMGLVAGLSILTFLFITFFNPVLAGGLMIVEGLLYFGIIFGLFSGDIFWGLKSIFAKFFTENIFLTYPQIFSGSLPLPGQSIMFPLIVPLAGIFLTYASNVIYQYINERKDKHFLKSTFGAYISPELIDQMYEEKQEPKLGGEAGYHTAFFSDIQSFSSFSEVMKPEDMVALMNEYLTEMTDILLKRHGTLDKYIGDEIVAFYGAPVPVPDHEYQACMTALEMQNKLGELRERWTQGDYPEIVHAMQHRIGMSSGHLVTGNMGSKMRMNYTMMGDMVNLGSRLESSAKQYGVYIQVEETLYTTVKEKFEWRFLDYVRVKGRKKPVKTFELLAEKGTLNQNTQQLLDTFHLAHNLYFEQKWDEAIKTFKEAEKLEDLFPGRNTNPSTVFIKRCEHLKNNPPGKSWDGVWTLTEK